jgi:hypothetical protein
MLPDIAVMEAYIRRAALARGIDPDTAVRVARSEGLAPGVWQAKANLAYGRERSYGPFQLHVAPQGYRGGMGNDMIAQTGIDPSNPANWQAGIDFALNGAARNGWGAWYGAKKIGVTGMMGINGGRTVPVSTGQAMQPGAYTAGEYVPEHNYTPYAPNMNVQPAVGPPPVPKRTAYTDMMRRSIEKGSPANEARQQIAAMEAAQGTGGGFKIPGLSALAGGKGGAGGKSGGGTSPRFIPATPPPAAGPPEIAIPGGDLPVGETPQLSPPTQGPFPAPAHASPSQNMSRPEVQGPKQPYFDTVDSAESEMWNSGPGPYMERGSPGGVPYERKDSPLWDPRLKKFVPRLRPDTIS